MSLRTKLQVALTALAATAALCLAARSGTQSWLPFWLLLLAVLASSGLKIQLLDREASMSLDFPFILLGVVQLSPLQVILLAGVSVAAQCRFRVRQGFLAVQVGFNIANTMLATAAATSTFHALERLHLQIAPSLAVASIAFFLWNTGSVAMVLASVKGERAWTVWRNEYPWYLPFYLCGAFLAALVNWLSVRFGWGTALLLIPAVYVLYRSYVGQIARLKEKQQYLEETEALQLRTIEGLAMAIEAKDQNTHDHLFRVRHYVQSVGERLKLSRDELKALETASFLHDIGKLAVPEYIINKPGKLTPDEFEKMKIHPSVGADILERVRFPYPVVPIVRSHHEWWNGTGYPDGLRGTDIPIGARILTVVDCFDALTSDRPYRRGMTSTQALSMIRSLSGKQFDPHVVEVFAETFHASEQKLANMVPEGFTPLNTEIEIWRGLAPGAGYEAGSDENAPSRSQSFQGSADTVAGPNGEELATILAVANETAQALYELTQSTQGSLTADDTLAVIAARLARHIPFDVLAVYRKNAAVLERRLLHCARSFTFPAEPIALGEGLSGWAAERNQPLVNGNASVEPGCPLLPDGTPALRSGLSIPLLDAGGLCFGVLTLYAASAENFTRLHLRVLLAMQAKLSLSLQNAMREPAESESEDVDFLTGLPSARRLFLELEEQLNARTDKQQPMTIVVSDLNNFRSVNERRGQQTGDRVLRVVADKLRQSLHAGEMLARMGADEFAFVFPATVSDAAEARLQEICRTISAAASVAAPGVSLSSSAGTACYPEDGITAESLLACASRRMYLQKQRHYRENTTRSVDTQGNREFVSLSSAGV